jgi:hypothetical protein
MWRRRLPLILLLSLVIAAAVACGRGDEPSDAGPKPDTQARVGTPEPAVSAASPPLGCAVTPPNHDIPPGQGQNPGAAQAPYYGNGRLWTVLSSDGIVREAKRHDGSISQKFPWWRGVRGQLMITGRRLDARGPELRAHIPDGYGPTGFQATAIIFPTPGCWSVTGTVGEAKLSFVTLVIAAGA